MSTTKQAATRSKTFSITGKKFSCTVFVDSVDGRHYYEYLYGINGNSAKLKDQKPYESKEQATAEACARILVNTLAFSKEMKAEREKLQQYISEASKLADLKEAKTEPTTAAEKATGKILPGLYECTDGISSIGGLTIFPGDQIRVNKYRESEIIDCNLIYRKSSEEAIEHSPCAFWEDSFSDCFKWFVIDVTNRPLHDYEKKELRALSVFNEFKTAVDKLLKNNLDGIEVNWWRSRFHEWLDPGQEKTDEEFQKRTAYEKAWPTVWVMHLEPFLIDYRKQKRSALISEQAPIKTPQTKTTTLEKPAIPTEGKAKRASAKEIRKGLYTCKAKYTVPDTDGKMKFDKGSQLIVLDNWLDEKICFCESPKNPGVRIQVPSSSFAEHWKFTPKAPAHQLDDAQAPTLAFDSHNKEHTCSIWCIRGADSNKWRYEIFFSAQEKESIHEEHKEFSFAHMGNAFHRATEHLLSLGKKHGTGTDGTARAANYFGARLHKKLLDALKFKAPGTYGFRCSGCGSESLSRPEGMETLNHLEGHFTCDGCKREVPYHDDDLAAKKVVSKKAPSKTPKTENVKTRADLIAKTPLTQKVDGLDQVVLFDVPEVKQPKDPHAELFGYIHKDKIDRQRYKRKQTKFLAKLGELPPMERNALIRAITAKFPPPKF